MGIESSLLLSALNSRETSVKLTVCVEFLPQCVAPVALDSGRHGLERERIKVSSAAAAAAPNLEASRVVTRLVQLVVFRQLGNHKASISVVAAKKYGN